MYVSANPVQSSGKRTRALKLVVQASVPYTHDDNYRNWHGYEHQCTSMLIMKDVIKNYVERKALLIRVQIETEGYCSDDNYQSFLICEYVYILTTDGYKVHWIRSGIDKKVDMEATVDMLDLVSKPYSQYSLDSWVKARSILESKGWDTNVSDPLTYP